MPFVGEDGSEPARW